MATLSLSAQNEGERMGPPPQGDPSERIVKELKLDDATATKFNEVYKAYKEEEKALHPQRTQGEKPKNPEELSDAEIEQMILSNFDMQQKQLDLKRSYYPKWREFLTPGQIQKLYMMERPMGGRGHEGGRPRPPRNRGDNK